MAKPTLLVCIPTIKGRGDFLANAIEGYRDRTPEADVYVSLVRDRPTAGVGWQECIEDGLARAASGICPWPDYIHFSNDDIVVAEGWFPPLKEAVDKDNIPAPRMEPAGVHLGEEVARSMAPAIAPAPSNLSYWFAKPPEEQPGLDWEGIDHGALPFCSLQQWAQIEPFIPIHFGTDQWFYFRAREAGYPVVARMDSVIFNYAAQVGRDKGEWKELDLIDFDLVFAYPEYQHGERDPSEPHPLRLTPAGLTMVRNWRKATFPGPHHWES